MPQLPIFFENRKSVGGYEFTEGAYIREKIPHAAYETVKFDEITFQAALREIITTSEMFASEQQPNLARQRVIDFYNSYGPLTGSIETWISEGGPFEYNDMDSWRETDHFVDERTPLPGEPLMIFMFLPRAVTASISRRMTTRVVEVTDGYGNLAPHIQPNDLFVALFLSAKFPSENTWVICEYFQKYGQARPRRKGACPPQCMIQTDGRRAWGDGCSEADRKQRRKVEKKVAEK